MSDVEQALRDAIENAIEDAILGEPLRPGLGNRAKSAAMAVLYKHNVRGAQVKVTPQGAGFAVHVTLPPGPQRARAIVLRFGQM